MIFQVDREAGEGLMGLKPGEYVKQRVEQIPLGRIERAEGARGRAVAAACRPHGGRAGLRRRLIPLALSTVRPRPGPRPPPIPTGHEVRMTRLQRPRASPPASRRAPRPAPRREREPPTPAPG